METNTSQNVNWNCRCTQCSHYYESFKEVRPRNKLCTRKFKSKKHFKCLCQCYQICADDFCKCLINAEKHKAPYDQQDKIYKSKNNRRYSPKTDLDYEGFIISIKKISKGIQCCLTIEKYTETANKDDKKNSKIDIYDINTISKYEKKNKLLCNENLNITHETSIMDIKSPVKCHNQNRNSQPEIQNSENINGKDIPLAIYQNLKESRNYIPSDELITKKKTIPNRNKQRNSSLENISHNKIQSKDSASIILSAKKQSENKDVNKNEKIQSQIDLKSPEIKYSNILKENHTNKESVSKIRNNDTSLSVGKFSESITLADVTLKKTEIDVEVDIMPDNISKTNIRANRDNTKTLKEDLEDCEKTNISLVKQLNIKDELIKVLQQQIEKVNMNYTLNATKKMPKCEDEENVAIHFEWISKGGKESFNFKSNLHDENENVSNGPHSVIIMNE